MAASSKTTPKTLLEELKLIAFWAMKHFSEKDNARALGSLENVIKVAKQAVTAIKALGKPRKRKASMSGIKPAVKRIVKRKKKVKSKK